MAAHLPDASKTVEVQLLGRTYRVACEDDKREELMEAVAYLERLGREAYEKQNRT